MISEDTDINSYTWALRSLMGFAFRAGFQAAQHRKVPGDAFIDWMNEHNEERGNAAVRFARAAVKDGYV